MKAIMVYTDKPAEMVESTWDLNELQEAVGGLIEALPNEEPVVTYWANEEAKFLGENGGPLPTNFVTTFLLGERLFKGDFISGTVVITGNDPTTGETVGLETVYSPKDLEDWLNELHKMFALIEEETAIKVMLGLGAHGAIKAVTDLQRTGTIPSLSVTRKGK